MNLLKKLLNGFHPILKPLSRWYLSKPRTFSYHGIKVNVLPGVFHPGLFFSTQVFLNYLSTRELKGKRLLELGAGSGLISIYCRQKGATVTSSDISKTAIQCIRQNAINNNTTIEIVESDLFEKINPTDFDIIIINPPYYPKPVVSEKDMPWFCGEHFEYFERLFNQLKGHCRQVECLMILSEDCALETIQAVAAKHAHRLEQIHAAQKLGEWNFIYRISE